MRQCVVLLVGSLARHLGSDDARIRPIALRLVAALNTPSQQVQEAVSNCLPHLVMSQALKEEVPVIVNKLMKQLLTAEKYGDRKVIHLYTSIQYVLRSLLTTNSCVL